MNEAKAAAGQRLKQERARLGLSGLKLSALCDVQHETWYRYEKGAMAPGFEVLQALAANGADVLYILTGERNPQVAETAEQIFRQQATALGFPTDAVDRMARSAFHRPRRRKSHADQAFFDGIKQLAKLIAEAA